MSFFGYHYIQGMLTATGWPRRKSFISSKAVIDSLVLDVIVNQMIEWAASIGAEKPKLAAQILATMFHGADWDNFGLPTMIEPIKEKWSSKKTNNPIQIVNPTGFSELGKTTNASMLNDRKIQHTFEGFFYEALLWGLSFPELFEAYDKEKRQERIDRLPVYKEIGVDKIPTLEEDLVEAEKIIHSYEETMNQPLSSIPQRLLNDIKVLGRF